MSIVYNGDHSITFGDGTVRDYKFVGTNTWTDWHLVPAARPMVVTPEVSKKQLTLPGRDGFIDMSEYLTGGLTYGARSGSWQFFSDHDQVDWISNKQKIIDFLHGKWMKVVLEDEPMWYYEGRFEVADWQNGSDYSSVTINYTLDSYKRYILGAGQWLWDPFCFDTDRTDTITDKRI